MQMMAAAVMPSAEHAARRPAGAADAAAADAGVRPLTCKSVSVAQRYTDEKGLAFIMQGR